MMTSNQVINKTEFEVKYRMEKRIKQAKTFCFITVLSTSVFYSGFS